MFTFICTIHARAVQAFNHKKNNNNRTQTERSASSTYGHLYVYRNIYVCYIKHSRYGTGENLGALFARAAGKSMMVAVMRNGRGTAPQTRQSFSLCLALWPNCLCAAVRFLAMIFHVPMVASLSVYVCVCVSHNKLLPK